MPRGNMSATNLPQEALSASHHADTTNAAGTGSAESFAVRAWRATLLLMLAAWFGASVFFAAALAPVLFEVLPTRELAGQVVGRALAILNTGGFVVGLILFTDQLSRSVYRARRQEGRQRKDALPSSRMNRVRNLSAWVAPVLLIVTCAANQWIVSARIAALRLLMNRPVDLVAKDDPLRIEFGSLHAVSVALLAIGIVAASLMLLTRRGERRLEIGRAE